MLASRTSSQNLNAIAFSGGHFVDLPLRKAPSADLFYEKRQPAYPIAATARPAKRTTGP